MYHVDYKSITQVRPRWVISAVNYSYEQNRNLRTVVDNNSATGLVSRFEYTYDAAGRRTERLDSLALTNTFAYNVRSELIEAVMDTNEYKYAYDSIGNREPSSQGYAVPGWAQMNAQSNSYVANDLNQYLTNIIDGTTSEALFYDADGTLTNANGWTFSWNGENRLIRASDGTTTVSYAYDYMGRRIRKDVVSDTRDDSSIFIYDGWNLIAELGGQASSPARADYYVWGLDLSGSLQGAGGINKAGSDLRKMQRENMLQQFLECITLTINQLHRSDPAGLT